MTKVLERIKERAAALHKHIVLPEGEDARVVRAAADAVKEGIAAVTLLGNPEEIKKNNPGVDLAGVTIVDPKTSEKRAAYARLLYELRKAKGMTEEQAEELSGDNTYFGVLMLKAGDVDASSRAPATPRRTRCAPACRSSRPRPAFPWYPAIF